MGTSQLVPIPARTLPTRTQYQVVPWPTRTYYQRVPKQNHLVPNT